MKSALRGVVLVLYLTFLDGVKFRCDYMYTDLGWFKYHELPLTFYDAFWQCKHQGGMLASPTTVGIKSVMMELICNTDTFTGIHSTFTSEQYNSIDSTPLVQIHHAWGPFEPDNKFNAENCIVINSRGRLFDVSCDVPRPYICHRKHSNIDVTICGTPDLEYRFYNRTNKCYKFHSKPKSFAPAYFTCAAEGGHLAIINSDEELEVIYEIHALYPPSKIAGRYDKNSAFLGFYYVDTIADWITIDGHSLEDAGFSKFDSGQPSNSSTGQYCGAVYRNGLFNDVSCQKRLAFICEKIPDYPAVCDSNSPRNNIRVCDRK